MHSDDAPSSREGSRDIDRDICNIKSILKKRSNKHVQLRKTLTFDEQNIIQTCLMTGRNYEYTKLKEPKTAHGDESKGDIDHEELIEKLQKAAREQAPTFGDEDLSDDDFFEPLYEKAHRMEFELRRKDHYKEYEQVALARRLIFEDFGSDASTEEYDFAFESLFMKPKCGDGLVSEENREEPGGTTDALIETQSSQQGNVEGVVDPDIIAIDGPGPHDSVTSVDVEHPCFGRIRDL